MNVPLAGPHPGGPINPSPASENQQNPQKNAEQTIFGTPKPPSQTQPPPAGNPPPLDKPLFLRILPFFIGIVVLGVFVFALFTIVPRLFGLAKPSGPVELTYWGLWEDEGAIAPIIADYEKDHPNVKITYQKQSLQQYRETLQNRLAGNDSPDLFRFHNTWVPMLREFLVPVPSDVYSKTSFDKTFYPVAQKDLAAGNSYLGIPLEIDTLALFINQDDFAAQGLNPPTDWEQLRNDAVSLTVRDASGRIQKGGVALGTFDNVDHASDILALMMMQNNVNFNKIDSTVSQNGDNLGEDTLHFYVDVFSKGDSKVWDETLDPSTLAFAKEKAAMYFGYSWDIFQITSLNPSLHFKVIPVPQLPTSHNAFASYWVEGVSKKSKHPTEAFDFLKYLSSPDVMQKMYTLESKTRQFGEPYSRVDLADKLKGTPIETFVSQGPFASSWYLASDTFDNGLNDGMIKYIADAIRAVGSGTSPKTALETAAQGFSQVATQYGL